MPVTSRLVLLKIRRVMPPLTCCEYVGRSDGSRVLPLGPPKAPKKRNRCCELLHRKSERTVPCRETNDGSVSALSSMNSPAFALTIVEESLKTSHATPTRGWTRAN